MKFNHGARIKECSIKGTIITDARISVDDGGRVYICQNFHGGLSADDKLGYKCSWCIGYDTWKTGDEAVEYIILDKKETTMDLVKKWKEVGLKEPKKTFRQIGITGSDDMPTEEGIKIFVAWLLADKEMGNKFYNDVAKPIREEEEKNEEE